MGTRIRSIVADGGGQFHAMQRVPADMSREKRSYFIVYFHAPKHGSTLVLKVKGLTVADVRDHIELSNKRMGV